MITISTIISLSKNGLLKDCKFISRDSSLAMVEVCGGEVFFTSVGDRIPASSVTKEELDRIDDDNDYWLVSELDADGSVIAFKEYVNKPICSACSGFGFVKTHGG